MVRELENEQAIIHRCQNGDVRAYKTIYDHFSQPLLNLGLRMLGHRQDAEDAVQMAFVKLYRGIHNFQFASKFSTYLFRIMMNVCYDVLQKRKRNQTQDIENIEISHQPGFDLSIQLEEAIETLPERMRACFVLFAVQGFKQDEIAEVMDLSVGTVKAHVFQAKIRLRELLSNSPKEAS